MRIFKEEINAHKKGYSFYVEKAEEWSFIVCQYAPYIKKELLEVFDEVLSYGINLRYEMPYYKLMEYIIKKANMVALLPICIEFHDVIPKILELFWIENPKKDTFRPLGSSAYKYSEYSFGLDEDLDGVGGYFPSSAFQTPVYPLLLAEYSIYPKQHNIIDFVIDFVNKCIDIYKIRGAASDDIDEINVVLPNGSKSKLIASQALWNLYRGTSGLSMPNVLECIHMALEKFLLQLYDKKVPKDDISALLVHILNRSRSISLWALVASVVSAHYDDFFKILLVFFQDYRFLSYDLTRFSHELTAHTLAFAYIGKEELEKERTLSNKLKHRQIHLEKILQMLQINYADSDSQEVQCRLKQLYDCVDVLKQQVNSIPQEDKNYEDYMIARIDYRTMIKEQVTLRNGVKAMQYTPNLSDYQKESNLELDRTNTQMIRGFKLREWVNNAYMGNMKDIKSPYDDIHFVLSEIRNIEKLIDSHDASLFKLMSDEYLPYMADAVLLLRFLNLLSRDEIMECKNKVLGALVDMDFLTSNTLSGLEVCLDATPLLLSICDIDEKKTLKKILLDYVDNHNKYGNTRPCDLVRKMLVRSHLWKEYHSFMEDCLNELLQKKSGFETDNSKSLSVISLLADDISHINLVEKCLDCISSEWIPKVSHHGHEYYSQDRYDDAELVADVIINLDDNLIPKFVSFFSRYISRQDHYEPLINSFLLKVIETNRYKQFWIIWRSIYSCMIIGIDKTFSSDALNSYLLNPPYFQKSSEKWFILKDNDVDFFKCVINDAGRNPNVLSSVVNVFNTIGIDYALDIIQSLATLMRDNLVYDGEIKLIKNLIFLLEDYLRNIFANHEDIITKDKQIKRDIYSILFYMKRHGSTQASDYLRNY